MLVLRQLACTVPVAVRKLPWAFQCTLVEKAAEPHAQHLPGPLLQPVAHDCLVPATLAALHPVAQMRLQVLATAALVSSPLQPFAQRCSMLATLELLPRVAVARLRPSVAAALVIWPCSLAELPPE